MYWKEIWKQKTLELHRCVSIWVDMHKMKFGDKFRCRRKFHLLKGFIDPEVCRWIIHMWHTQILIQNKWKFHSFCVVEKIKKKFQRKWNICIFSCQWNSVIFTDIHLIRYFCLRSIYKYINAQCSICNW